MGARRPIDQFYNTLWNTCRKYVLGFKHSALQLLSRHCWFHATDPNTGLSEALRPVPSQTRRQDNLPRKSLRFTHSASS